MTRFHSVFLSGNSIFEAGVCASDSSGILCLSTDKVEIQRKARPAGLRPMDKCQYAPNDKHLINCSFVDSRIIHLFYKTIKNHSPMRSVLIYSFILFLFIPVHAQLENQSWALIELEHEGPEDFVYDSVYNRLIIPSGRRDSKHPENSYGVFQTLDLTDHSVKTLSQDAELNKWISLGIKLAPFDTTFQFMTNAAKSGEDIGRIQGLSIDANSVNLVSRSIVLGNLPSSINNIRWVEGKGLYISNLYKAKTMKAGYFSNLKGEVYRADNFGQTAEVLVNVHGPNSFGVLDSTLYLTGTRERFLLMLNENDEAVKIKTIPIAGGDNITIQDQKLYTTGSPKVLEVVKYMSEKRETLGSLIYEMINENGQLRCSRIILVDPSIGVGMISVVHRHRGTFYCGQVKGPEILCFKDDGSCLTVISDPKKNRYVKKMYARYLRLNRKEGIPLPEFVILKST